MDNETPPPNAVEDDHGELRADRVSDRFRECVPRDFARRHLIISQGSRNGVERLVTSPTTSRFALHNVAAHLGVQIGSITRDAESIARLIDDAYADRANQDGKGSDENSAIAVDDDIDQLLSQSDRDILTTDGKGPVVRLVDTLLFEALRRRASDLHVQPLDDRTLIRYRLDGVLHTVREVPRRITNALISRIKVMGRMDIAERRIPQDGRATVTLGGSPRAQDGLAGNIQIPGAPGARCVDLRISTLPTAYGERAVIRLLDNSSQLCDFERLGMPSDTAEHYLRCAKRANGIILVTGPTGSGKTTTLYATLREIGSAQVNIMTIEDPIEYELATVGLAISQSQVAPRKGVTFASGLRHILRQDPDIIMVGEIRDIETARIAIQSSLTGHLVFSTLHTNDAASAVTRLIDLGVEPYLLSASLSAVLAQRLVRRIHRECQGQGCEACFDMGYTGRVGLFELLSIDETFRELITRNASLGEIRSKVQETGARSLAEEGDRLVRTGMTSRIEVERVVQATGGDA